MHAGLVSTLETPWQAFLKSSDGMWSSLTETKPHPGQISHLFLEMCFHSLKPFRLPSVLFLCLLPSLSPAVYYVKLGVQTVTHSSSVQNRWGLVLKSTRCHHLSHLQTLQGRDLFFSSCLVYPQTPAKAKPRCSRLKFAGLLNRLNCFFLFFFHLLVKLFWVEATQANVNKVLMRRGTNAFPNSFLSWSRLRLNPSRWLVQRCSGHLWLHCAICLFV